jgi:hypothetical protein
MVAREASRDPIEQLDIWGAIHVYAFLYWWLIDALPFFCPPSVSILDMPS